MAFRNATTQSRAGGVAVLLLPLSLLPALLSAAPDSPASQARQALEKAIPLVERSAAEYTRQRNCFSCHHQGMPAFALVAARAEGFKIDEAALQQQLEFTH